MFGDGLSGPALDRWITGNYGEDQFSGYEDMCDECVANKEEDWNCPYDYDGAKCFDEQKADALEYMEHLSCSIDLGED